MYDITNDMIQASTEIARGLAEMAANLKEKIVEQGNRLQKRKNLLLNNKLSKGLPTRTCNSSSSAVTAQCTTPFLSTRISVGKGSTGVVRKTGSSLVPFRNHRRDL